MVNRSGSVVFMCHCMSPRRCRTPVLGTQPYCSIWSVNVLFSFPDLPAAVSQHSAVGWHGYSLSERCPNDWTRNGNDETFPEPLRGKLPILVKVRDFHQALPSSRDITAYMFESSLNSWLKQRKPGGLEWGAAKHQVEQGNTALIFETGIDEAPPAAREVFVKGLGECAPLWMQSGNRILVTSRPYGGTRVRCSSAQSATSYGWYSV